MSLDGAFVPHNQPEGVYKRSYVWPYTILSWVDYSVDSRPGSHSTFLFANYKTDEAFSDILLKEAAKKFPQVFERQRQPIKHFENE